MDDLPLQSLAITHVSYDPSSVLSHTSAFLALLPQALMIVYVAFIYATRELEIILMFAGQLACEGLNWILKRRLRESRPTDFIGKGYGMPSSHAQFMAFWSVYLMLFLLVRHNPSKASISTSYVPVPVGQRVLVALFGIGTALAVAHSRVILRYHHPRQVYVGVAVGVACAVSYFILLSVARRIGIVDWLLDTQVARWVRVRDLLPDEDMVDAGWERWQQRRLLRRRSAAHTKKKL